MPLTKNNLYSDNEVFCGGVGQQFKKNKGKCGVCGDDWSTKRPRLNENGGTWGTGTIGKTYFQGQVRITNYGGFQLLDLIITELKSHMTC